jgi:hypothetical protein
MKQSHASEIEFTKAFELIDYLKDDKSIVKNC